MRIINKWSPKFWSTWGGNKVRFIIVHQFDAKEKNPTLEGTVNWLFREDVQLSVHEALADTTVYKMVRRVDRAWHAMEANHFAYGIEVDPNFPGETFETACQRAAKACKYYGLSEKAIVTHNHAMKAYTACGRDIPIKKIRARVKEILKGESMITPRILRVLFLFLCGRLPSPSHYKKYVGKYTPEQTYAMLLNSNAHKSYKKQRSQAFDTISANTSSKLGR